MRCHWPAVEEPDPERSLRRQWLDLTPRCAKTLRRWLGDECSREAGLIDRHRRRTRPLGALAQVADQAGSWLLGFALSSSPGEPPRRAPIYQFAASSWRQRLFRAQESPGSNDH